MSTTKYKEIIYLDTDTMNSMLAQLDGGIIQTFAIEENSQQTDTFGTSEEASANARARAKIEVSTGSLPGGKIAFDGALGGKLGEGQNRSTAVLEGQKDILNKAFHDYSLSLLFKDLEENNLLKEEVSLNSGDICSIQGEFKFYDFDLLNTTTNVEAMEKLMLHEIDDIDMTLKKAYEISRKHNASHKQKEDSQKVIEAHKAAKPILQALKQLNLIGTLGGNLLKKLAIIKVGNYIGLVEKTKLRESSEALSFRTDFTREATFLFQVIGKKKKVFNGFNIPLFSVKDLDKIPNMFLDIVLGSFEIIEKDNILIKPIAIFYE